MSISSGLVAAYKFNEGTGDSAKDELGGEPIALTNISYVGNGIEANANGEIGVFDNTSQIINLRKGTLVLKYKSNTIFADGANRFIFGILGPSNDSGDFYLFKNINDLYFLFHDGVGLHYIIIQSAKIPNWNNGTQIALQWDKDTIIANGDKMAFNIDGSYVVPDLSGNETSWVDNALSNNIGILNDYGDQNGDRFANGIIDYLYFFNNIKTASELSEIEADPDDVLADYRHVRYTSSLGLTAYYDFDEIGQSTAVDKTGNGNDISIIGTAEITADGLLADASGDYGQLNNALQLIDSEKGTIVLTFKSIGVYADSIDRAILGRINFSGAGMFAIYKDASNNFFFTMQDSVSYHYVRLAGASFPNWQNGCQISVMWDRSTNIWNSDKMVINIDGVNITPSFGEYEAAWNSFTVYSPLAVGNKSSGGTPMNGYISDLMIFNEIKTEDQLKMMVSDKSYVLEEYFNQGQNNNSNSVSVMVGL